MQTVYNDFRRIFSPTRTSFFGGRISTIECNKCSVCKGYVMYPDINCYPKGVLDDINNWKPICRECRLVEVLTLERLLLPTHFQFERPH